MVVRRGAASDICLWWGQIISVPNNHQEELSVVPSELVIFLKWVRINGLSTYLSSCEQVIYQSVNLFPGNRRHLHQEKDYKSGESWKHGEEGLSWKPERGRGRGNRQQSLSLMTLAGDSQEAR